MYSHPTQAQRFQQDPSLCNLFKLFASETWFRIALAHRQPGLRIFETTLTQNIIYQFALYTQLYRVPVAMYEASDEKTNGNDIEFEILTPKGLVTLPMQAKLMYRNGRYPQMAHPGQNKALIRYAETHKGYPLYLLYNFYPARPFTPLYGISLVSAYHIRNEFSYPFRKKLKIPHFNSLHPSPAIPWHELVCNYSKSSPAYILSLFEHVSTPPESLRVVREPSVSYGLYSEMPSWIPIDFDTLGKKKALTDKDNFEMEAPLSFFAPRYKIRIGA